MKRSQIKRRPLADTVLASLEPEAREYRESYGGDRLYFVVSPAGRKRWEVRYKKPATGRWAWMGIGSYPEVRPRVARETAREIADKVAEGIDPVEERRAQRGAHGRLTSVRVMAEEWICHRIERGEYGPDTAYAVRRIFAHDIIPEIGATPVSRVTRADCAKIQRRVEARGAMTLARKCRIALYQLFEYAHALGACDDNPAAGLRVTSRKAPPSRPFAFLREAELPDFLRKLRATERSGLQVRVAAWVCVYLASRPGMIRWMHWDELDLGEATWTISADKMKSGRDFVSPLSAQVVDLLRQVRPFAGRDGHVFPNRNAGKRQLYNGKPNAVLSVGAINKCLGDHVGYEGRMTSHGTRHTAKTLLTEHGWPNDWSEMQLAHALPGGGNATYNRALWLKQRRAMMQWYADYLDALERGVSDEEVEAFDARVMMPGGGYFGG